MDCCFFNWFLNDNATKSNDMEMLSLKYMGGGWTHVHMFYPCPLARVFRRWATDVMCMLQPDLTKQGMW